PALSPFEAERVKSAPLLAVLANEIDALLDFRHAVVPVVLVFDGDVSLKALLLQFVQDLADAANAGSIGHVMARRTEVALVLKVAADDPALEHSQAIDRIKAAGLPVTGVGASTDARVPILGNLDDVMRVPDL